MIELKITKVPAMTPEGRFMLAPEDAESIRMQVLRADVRNTLEGYGDTFDQFESMKDDQKRIYAVLADDTLLDAFIRRMDDGHAWSIADLVLAWDSPMHDWEYAPAEEKAVCEVLGELEVDA